MLHRTVIGIALAALWAAASGQATAEPIRMAQAQLPPYEILTIIRSTGLDPLSQPIRRGSTYILRALDGYGEEVRVVVDAQRGRILSVRPVAMASGYEADPRYAPEPVYPSPYQPGAIYEPEPFASAGPPVIYAPRAALPSGNSPPKAASSAKKPAPPPKAAAVAPAKPAELPPPEAKPAPSTSGAAPAETKTPPETSSPALPPVQSLE
jgi:hypothetical protein